MKKKGLTAEQKLARYLAERDSSRCLHCSYYSKKDSYCNDLDCKVDPDFPICSNENYNA